MTARPAWGDGEIRPEIELLLRTARPGAEPTNDARIEELVHGGLSWDLVLGQARAHGTLPLLHWHLQRREWATVPPAAQESLRDELCQNAALNLLRTRELLHLLAQLRVRGIAALPFKGPTLAAYAYGSLALRQFIDLDLLLRPEDLAAGWEVLVAEGYTPAVDLPAARQRDYLWMLGQAPFYRQRDAGLVELHSRVMPRSFHFPLGLEDLWGRAELLRLQGETVRVLAADDLLLVLCAHAAKHRFECLGWISDLAALLLKRPALDLAWALEQARQLRSERLLLLGLHLGYDLLQAAPPEAVDRQLRADPVARALAAGVWRGLTGGSSPGAFRGALFHVRVREHLRDGLVYSLSLALQPTVADWEMAALPRAATFLYYGLRPLRLAWKHGRLLFAGLGRLWWS
jgi:hypothetical protein